MSSKVHDVVEHPRHYTEHASGIECIQITEHMGFNLGNAIKYIWRCDLKKDAIEDLKKARWYLDREIALREKSVEKITSPAEKPNAAPTGWIIDAEKSIGCAPGTWLASVIEEHGDAVPRCPQALTGIHRYHLQRGEKSYGQCACGRALPHHLDPFRNHS